MPGVLTVPVSLVGAFAAQLVGKLPHSEPTQPGPPDVHAWPPMGPVKHEAASPQVLSGVVQQSSTLPQPSEARPHVCPSWAHVLGVQLEAGVPQLLGMPLPPQNAGAVQVTPPLAGAQV